jgi:hypothetical protein
MSIPRPADVYKGRMTTTPDLWPDADDDALRPHARVLNHPRLSFGVGSRRGRSLRVSSAILLARDANWRPKDFDCTAP